jgi:hypothetical protein
VTFREPRPAHAPLAFVARGTRAYESYCPREGGDPFHNKARGTRACRPSLSWRRSPAGSALDFTNDAKDGSRVPPAFHQTTLDNFGIGGAIPNESPRCRDYVFRMQG